MLGYQGLYVYFSSANVLLELGSCEWNPTGSCKDNGHSSRQVILRFRLLPVVYLRSQGFPSIIAISYQLLGIESSYYNWIQSCSEDFDWKRYHLYLQYFLQRHFSVDLRKYPTFLVTDFLRKQRKILTRSLQNFLATKALWIQSRSTMDTSTLRHLTKPFVFGQRRFEDVNDVWYYCNWLEDTFATTIQ
jgi:hypothetical protein